MKIKDLGMIFTRKESYTIIISNRFAKIKKTINLKYNKQIDKHFYPFLYDGKENVEIYLDKIDTAQDIGHSNISSMLWITQVSIQKNKKDQMA